MDRNQIAFRMVARCLLVVVIYSVCVVAGIFFLRRYIPYLPSTPLGVVAMFVLVLGGGGVFIVFVFFKKSLWYMQKVAEAADQLIHEEDKPILLPDEIKSVQDQMNLIREEARRNKALAREAEQRKNDLVTYLAHDLRTPLTSIIGYLSLLKEAPDMPIVQRSQYTGVALEKAERLEGLINEFFEITKLNMAEFSLELGITNLSRMMEQIASEFAIDLEEKDLSWQLNIPSGVEIQCDSGKLARAMDNLIRNAIKFSYPGTPLTFSLAPERGYVTIALSNLGDTIPEDKLERIFEQFFRLDSARGTSQGGAGLGLAIAKEIVDLHGGQIHALSKEGVTTFKVILPVAGPGTGASQENRKN